MENLLNLEKRTGISTDEIDDFIRKATAVEDAIKHLRDGTIDPNSIKIDGIETEEEKLEKEKKRQQRREELRREEEELKMKRKVEEKERWWSGAELHVSHNNENKSDNEDNMTPQQANLLDRYSANYSRWEQWIPQDPATLQEKELKEKEEEEKQNKLFEENNKEFCTQFLNDMNERKKQSEKKQQTATTLKLKGNRYFKAKKYTEALDQYMEALKLAPFDGTAILTNIAQAQIQLQNYDDALEFLNRALYLNPKCIKALSRKAHVLGERMITKESDPQTRMNLMSQAVECITKAHKLESENTEITTQYNELTQALNDLKNEQHVQDLSSKESTKELIQTMEKIVNPESKTTEQPLQTLLSSLSDPNSPQVETIASFAVFDRLKTILLSSDLSQFDDLLYQTVLHALNDKTAQVYFRTSETLNVILTNVESSLSHLSQILNESSSSLLEHEEHQSMLLSKLLKILSSALNDERSSKIILIESYSNIIPLTMELLSRVTLPMNVLNSLLFLLQALISNHYMKSRNQILKNKQFILNIGGAICRLLSSFVDTSTGRAGAPTSNAAGGTTPPSLVDIKNSIQLCSQLLKEFFYTEDGKKFLISQTSCTMIVSVYGLILQQYYEDHLKIPLSNKKNKNKNELYLKNLHDLAELSIEILLGCSQFEFLCSAFLDNIQDTSTSTTSTPTTTSTTGNGTMTNNDDTATITTSYSTIQLILKLLLTEEWIQSNGLAILMNITIHDDDNQRIRHILYTYNAFDICLQIIKKYSKDGGHGQGQGHGHGGDKEEVTDSSRLRAIGLLSRLGTLSEIQNKLKEYNCYLLLMNIFIINSKYLLEALYPSTPSSSSSSSPAAPPLSNESYLTLLRDECYQLIRLFALLTNISEECLHDSYELGYLDLLLSYLPLPHMELHEITPQSVILPPNETFLWNKKNSLLVGNIARCLIPYADHTIYSHAIYQKKQNYGIEKLVCMMATCSQDIRIRKNIAIILAKGCRNNEIKKKIEYYRGIQMIVELQNQLI